MRVFAIALAATLGTVFLLNTNTVRADKDKEKAKATISEVMRKAHKGDDALRTKLLKGDASADEKAELLALYVALSLNTPPKGDVDAWKARTKAILDSYNKGDIDKKAFTKATNCGSCHDMFKK
jgi:hypothetical protein